MGAPWVYFVTVALYGLVLLLLTPALAARMPDFAPATPVASRAPFSLRLLALLRESALTLRSRSTLCLLLAAAGVGWVIQSGHYGVSLLLAEADPSGIQRVGLAILIPLGVFIGSSLNQAFLARLT